MSAWYKLVFEPPPSRAAHRELRRRELAALFIDKAPSVYETRAGHCLHDLAAPVVGPRGDVERACFRVCLERTHNARSGLPRRAGQRSAARC